jgi:arginine decarboxylase
MDLAQIRLDVWNRLLEASDRLRSQPEQREAVEGLLRLVSAYERYWIFPGAALLARLAQRFERRDFELFHEELNLVVKALGEYGDRAALFGDMDDLERLAREGFPRDKRHYFTVLIVGDQAPARVEAMRADLRAAQRDTTDFCYDVLSVRNLEDALAAAAFNYDVQACVILEDFPLRAEGAPDAVRGLLDEYEATLGAAANTPRGHLLAQALRQLRPSLDLYLMSPVSGAATERAGRGLFDRVFYRLENNHEIHMTVVAGVRERYRTPFFDALKNYAQRPIGNFHALPIARGHSILNSKWIEDMGEFYGTNIFMAETSTTSGGLDSLLEPTGTIKEAQEKAAKTWGSQRTFFATNGTSTSNKIVVQGLTGPGDIVLIDRNCHKSHHYGMILGGAHPLYLDAYPLEPYAMYGAVPLRTIKKTLIDLKKAGRLDRVKMLLLTNCTFDGQTYNPQRVMEEVLAIKPDMVFLWDEAWYAFARFLSLARQRTAMHSAKALEERFASDAYKAEYREWAARFAKLDPKAEATWLDQRLMPDPAKVRLRVYATQSTHKSLSALRQGSMFHVYDQDYERKTQDQMIDAYLTHTSTSPNHQIVASLDLARRQADFEGYAMVRSVYQMALALRDRVSKDPLLSKYFRILEPKELIPAQYRASGIESYVGADFGAVMKAWRDDEFVLDPTRITLYLAQSGYNGAGFRSLLLDEYGIQHNKTSINSVLLIFTIGVTWSTMTYLLDVLRKIAEHLEHEHAASSDAEKALFAKKVQALTTGLPPLPSFSHFHPAFRPNAATPEGDMRGAYFLNYDVANREYVKLADAVEAVKAGRELVSTNLVVPYPPGFPVLVPGQVISAPILDFMRKLDVKEVHGYVAAVGLSVFTEKALASYAAQTGRTQG